MAETLTLKLSAPIQAHGETLSSLTLRRPTVKELRQCGSPSRLAVGGGATGMVPDYEACAALISAICAIPPSSVDQMDGADFDEAAMMLVGFTKRATVAAGEAASASKA